MHDLNFFSPYIGEKKERINGSMLLAGTIGFICILMITITGVNALRIRSLERELSLLSTYINGKEKVEKVRTMEEQQRKIKVMEKYLTTLGEIQDQMDHADKIRSILLKEVAAAIPDKLFFQSISFTRQDVKIQGVAMDRISIAEFEHNLKKIPSFQEVHVDSIVLNSLENQRCTFSLKCTFKDVIHP